MTRKGLLFFIFFILIGCEPQQTVTTQSTTSENTQKLPAIAGWPPRLNKAFPDIELISEKGELVSLSSFGGYVLLVEFIKMPKSSLPSASNNTALSTQATTGTTEAPEQMNENTALHSPRDYFPEYARLKSNDHRVKHVQILVYGPANEQAKQHHLEWWAESQVTKTLPKPLVFVSKVDLRNDATDQLLGGYLMLDKDGIVQFNAAGPRPKHDFFTELLPALEDHVARLSNPEGKYKIEWSGSDSDVPEEGKDDYIRSLKPLKQ